MINLVEFTSKIRLKLIVQAYKTWLKRNENCLDVGCGDGIISENLLRHFKIRITGCDVLSYLIKKIPFVYMPKKDKLPFSANEFDCILFNDVLHHMEKSDQIRILKEALRITKKVLIFEDRPTLMGKISDILANLIHNHNMNVPLTFRDVPEWENIFRSLRIEYVTAILPRPFLYPVSHIAFILKRPSLDSDQG